MAAAVKNMHACNLVADTCIEVPLKFQSVFFVFPVGISTRQLHVNFEFIFHECGQI